MSVDPSEERSISPSASSEVIAFDPRKAARDGIAKMLGRKDSKSTPLNRDEFYVLNQIVRGEELSGLGSGLRKANSAQEAYDSAIEKLSAAFDDEPEVELCLKELRDPARVLTEREVKLINKGRLSEFLESVIKGERKAPASLRSDHIAVLEASYISNLSVLEASRELHLSPQEVPSLLHSAENKVCSWLDYFDVQPRLVKAALTQIVKSRWTLLPSEIRKLETSGGVTTVISDALKEDGGKFITDKTLRNVAHHLFFEGLGIGATAEAMNRSPRFVMAALGEIESKFEAFFGSDPVLCHSLGPLFKKIGRELGLKEPGEKEINPETTLEVVQLALGQDREGSDAGLATLDRWIRRDPYRFVRMIESFLRPVLGDPISESEASLQEVMKTAVMTGFYQECVEKLRARLSGVAKVPNHVRNLIMDTSSAFKPRGYAAHYELHACALAVSGALLGTISSLSRGRGLPYDIEDSGYYRLATRRTISLVNDRVIVVDEQDRINTSVDEMEVRLQALNISFMRESIESASTGEEGVARRRINRIARIAPLEFTFTTELIKECGGSCLVDKFQAGAGAAICNNARSKALEDQQERRALVTLSL